MRRCDQLISFLNCMGMEVSPGTLSTFLKVSGYRWETFEQHHTPPVLLFLLCTRPHGLTFSWWGCYGLCLRHKPTELADIFYSVLVSVSVLWPFQLYFIPKILPTTLRSLTLLFRSYFCFIGSFNYISLYESLLQPWYNPLWLTGLKAPTH